MEQAPGGRQNGSECETRGSHSENKLVFEDKRQQAKRAGCENVERKDLWMNSEFQHVFKKHKKSRDAEPARDQKISTREA